MASKEISNVVVAFEILLEEIESEIDSISQLGAKAFENQDFPMTKESLENAGIMMSFREKVRALQKEWSQLESLIPRDEDEEEKSIVRRRYLGRIPAGLRTPSGEFHKPILRALQEMGGSGQTDKVLERVHELMKSELKDIDHEYLLSNPNEQRWHNTASWARKEMVLEGLLNANSERGIWELSDKGTNEHQ